MPPAIRITLASAMGTCFGVQRAIKKALSPGFEDDLTIVGQLVHNPQTVCRLRAHGIRMVERDELDAIETRRVMITAHGAANDLVAELERRGHEVHDASCPLVLRLHKLARALEQDGFFPVVIGQRDHVEVQGVIGNLRESAVVADESDLGGLVGHPRIGVVSQTTNRPPLVERLVEAIRRLPWVREVRYVDTICKPVRDRQRAIEELLASDIDLGIVVGGRNSSNTRKLFDLLTDRGIRAHHIEGADELQPVWLDGASHVGVTAGTSTPPEVIEAVSRRLSGMVERRDG